MTALRLYREIEERVSQTLSVHADWPCRKGCAHCCRHLAQLPALVGEEWQRVEEGLARLPESAQAEIAGHLAGLPAEGPYTCPFLDRDSGACRIYDHRPAACRTYGFYVERGEGLYCYLIRAKVDAGEYGQMVWGNQETVDRELDRLGRRVPLVEWAVTLTPGLVRHLDATDAVRNQL